MPTSFDVVVPIDYGSNKELTNISAAAIATLAEAAMYLNKAEYPSVLAFCNADLPHKGMRAEQSSRWKDKVLKYFLRKSHVIRFEVPAKISIDEAQNICATLERHDIQARRIIIFCDRWHEMRLRIVWKYVFRDSPAEIEFHPIWCYWGKDYALPYMQSKFRWIYHNFKGFIALKLLGVERFGRIAMKKQEQ